MSNICERAWAGDEIHELACTICGDIECRGYDPPNEVNRFLFNPKRIAACPNSMVNGQPGEPAVFHPERAQTYNINQVLRAPPKDGCEHHIVPAGPHPMAPPVRKRLARRGVVYKCLQCGRLFHGYYGKPQNQT